MSAETKYDYNQRINAIFDFIDANLDTDLSLETLSEMAAFSPYLRELDTIIPGERLKM